MGQSIVNRGSAPVRSDGPMGQAEMPPRDRDLTMCLGFQVDGPNGRIGTVIGIAYGSQTHRPDAIEIRVGLFHRIVIVVPPEEVIAADSSTKRLTLRRDPLPLRSTRTGHPPPTAERTVGRRRLRPQTRRLPNEPVAVPRTGTQGRDLSTIRSAIKGRPRSMMAPAQVFRPSYGRAHSGGASHVVSTSRFGAAKAGLVSTRSRPLR